MVVANPSRYNTEVQRLKGRKVLRGREIFIYKLLQGG
jgi:hypothetical protein